MKRLLSGIRISGTTHLGNYLGAIKQWVEMQNDYESYTFLADLHGLTTPFAKGEIAEKTLGAAKMYLALGLDPSKTTIFVQSHVPAHVELSWILGSIATMGELSRMTQFKEKAEGQGSVNLGLFAYPVLMAADILLYNPDAVPVGDDQKQHVELTRDIAQRFNSRFGQTFKIPQLVIQKESARIMGLDNAEKKMSKSAENANNYIALLDGPDVIRRKIKSAVTDSEADVRFDEENKPAVSNLMTIMSLVTGQPLAEIESSYQGKGYGDFKSDLAEAVVAWLTPIQEKYRTISDEKAKRILKEGSEKAGLIASKTMEDVKKKIGLLI